jgi:hypothetical protein
MSVLPCPGSIKTHSTPAPSYVLESLKNIDHMLEIFVLLVKLNHELVNMVQELL